MGSKGLVSGVKVGSILLWETVAMGVVSSPGNEIGGVGHIKIGVSERQLV